jgi:hypothetical protein
VPDGGIPTLDDERAFADPPSMEFGSKSDLELEIKTPPETAEVDDVAPSKIPADTKKLGILGGGASLGVSPLRKIDSSRHF